MPQKLTKTATRGGTTGEPQSSRTALQARMVSTLQEIAADMQADAVRFDGQPFNGRTVAEYLGYQGAAIAALARIIETLILNEHTDAPADLLTAYVRADDSTPTAAETSAIREAIGTAIAQATATNAVDPVLQRGQEDATRGNSEAIKGQ